MFEPLDCFERRRIKDLSYSPEAFLPGYEFSDFVPLGQTWNRIHEQYTRLLHLMTEDDEFYPLAELTGIHQVRDTRTKILDERHDIADHVMALTDIVPEIMERRGIPHHQTIREPSKVSNKALYGIRKTVEDAERFLYNFLITWAGEFSHS